VTPMSTLVLHRPVSPEARVLVLPHAGGSVTDYARLGPGLQRTELHGLQLPGRGARFNEAPLTDVLTIAELVADLVEDWTDLPLSLFGHSFGALVAFETCRSLRRHAAETRLSRLWVSAFPAPDRIRRKPTFHTLDAAALLLELSARFDSIPVEVLTNPELMELVAGYVRADYEALENYQFVAEPPLKTPIGLLDADGDLPVHAAPDDWSQHTEAEFTMHRFSGGHFYFHDADNAKALAKLLDEAAEIEGQPR
jgi:surfactin synthase thioesterase subunit